MGQGRHTLSSISDPVYPPHGPELLPHSAPSVAKLQPTKSIYETCKCPCAAPAFCTVTGISERRLPSYLQITELYHCMYVCILDNLSKQHKPLQEHFTIRACHFTKMSYLEM